MEEDEELDPELAEALRMSMQPEEGSDAATPSGAPGGDVRPADPLCCPHNLCQTDWLCAASCDFVKE